MVRFLFHCEYDIATITVWLSKEFILSGSSLAVLVKQSSTYRTYRGGGGGVVGFDNILRI